ncbi:MAG: DUF6686 family protein [Bacteroidota bacterium]
MCDHKILDHSEHGYVIRCEKCKHLQIAFGTIAISLTEKQLYEFMQAIKEYFETYKYYECRTEKIIRIPTVNQSILLVYSLNELETLIHIIEKAHMSLEIEKLLATDEN